MSQSIEPNRQLGPTGQVPPSKAAKGLSLGQTLKRIYVAAQESGLFWREFHLTVYI